MERGYLTDRYTSAIAQIGDDTLNVRLGGIYALEQIASDSEQDRDQAAIVEVLSLRPSSQRSARPVPSL